MPQAKTQRNRSLSSQPRHEFSPFQEKLESNPSFEAQNRYSKKMSPHMEVDTGVERDIEVECGGPIYYWKDKEVFTKIFRKDIEETLQHMSIPAIKLFWYIVRHLQMDKDWIIIPFETFSQFTRIKSRTSFYGAIVELCQREVIALSNSPNMFYVNPNVMFNGRREKLLPSAEGAFIRKYNFKMPAAAGKSECKEAA